MPACRHVSVFLPADSISLPACLPESSGPAELRTLKSDNSTDLLNPSTMTQRSHRGQRTSDGPGARTVVLLHVTEESVVSKIESKETYPAEEELLFTASPKGREGSR